IMNSHPMAFSGIDAACPRLNNAQLEALAKLATCKEFDAGETLLAAGERELRLFVIKTGEVAIVDPTSEKKEPVTVLGPGQFTGDIELLAGRPSAVSAIAQSDCAVYEVSADDLKRVLSDLPRISDTLLRAFLMRRQLIEEFG